MAVSCLINGAANIISPVYGWVIFHCPDGHHIFFIYFFINVHLGCFQVLAIVSSLAINFGVQVSFKIKVFFKYMPRNKIARSYAKSTHFTGLYDEILPFLDKMPYPG